MVAVFFNIIFILLYFYYVNQIGTIQKGICKQIITFMLLLVSIIIGVFLKKDHISWILITLIMMLFDLFYDENPFILQWYKVVSFGLVISVLLFLNKIFKPLSYLIIYEAVIVMSFVVLSKLRKNLTIINGILVIFANLIIVAITLCFEDKFIDSSMFMLSSLIFFILEFALQSYQTNFEKSTVYFQQNILHHQYEEIKNIYLNMRGWRHDYHSHLQTIKAHFALNQLDEVQKYLSELEHDLDRVDSYVKSGNLMTDAILNSKISIADNKNIKIICKAGLPETLVITDIDMCVILGNLLDNATEACMKIDEDKRFIRIYISVLKNQLYISIQNSAKEELNFNERNYISTKRGEHGLGMKRVKVLIDKYNGYLNMQNEPGIFASEVTIPLTDI